jgi:hypothetical protein
MFIKATFNHMTSSVLEVIQANAIENLLVQRHAIYPDTRSEVVGSQRDITKLIGCMNATGWVELLSVSQV